MKFNREINHRQSIRLRGFDYSSPGYYFITICIQNRDCLLGNVVNNKIELNEAGSMVQHLWESLPQQFDCIRLNRFTIMPNHLHGIIQINGFNPFDAIKNYYVNKIKIISNFESSEVYNGTTKDSISRMIQFFKSASTFRYSQSVKEHNWPAFDRHLWQKNFYEHIIRDAEELEQLRQYIDANPSNWKEDKDNPINFQ